MSKQKPLEGLRVLDFSHAYAGPLCSMYLADMGAEVIKIEKPGRGDGCRYMGTKMFDDLKLLPDFFIGLNRNKKSLLVDMKSPEGIELLYDLVPKFDVVIQNFRPGVMDHLGLGFEELAKRRPGLVYCSIAAFGFEGPMVDKPANDMIMQAASGLMATTGEEDGGPVRMQCAVTDYTTGLYALTGVLAALNARDRFPEGQHVKVSMLDACLGLMSNDVPKVMGLGKKLTKVGRRHQFSAPYEAFTCGDGKYLLVGAFTQKFWENLAKIMGCEQYVTDERFLTNDDRVKNRDELGKLLNDIFKTKPSDEWAKMLDEADIPNTPVYEADEVMNSEQIKVNGTIMRIGEDIGHPVDVLRYPLRCGAWDEDDYKLFPPVMGRDTREVLKEFEIPEDRVEKLMASKAIGDENFKKEKKK